MNTDADSANLSDELAIRVSKLCQLVGGSNKQQHLAKRPRKLLANLAVRASKSRMQANLAVTCSMQHAERSRQFCMHWRAGRSARFCAAALVISCTMYGWVLFGSTWGYLGLVVATWPISGASWYQELPRHLPDVTSLAILKDFRVLLEQLWSNLGPSWPNLPHLGTLFGPT